MDEYENGDEVVIVLKNNEWFIGVYNNGKIDYPIGYGDKQKIKEDYRFSINLDYIINQFIRNNR